MSNTVFVVATNELLRSAVVQRLRQGGVSPTIGAESLLEVEAATGSVLLMVCGEVTPAGCAYLIAGRGFRIGMLASMPTMHEQRSYQGAGARYIPMSLKPSPLLESVQDLLALPVPDLAAARHTFGRVVHSPVSADLEQP